MPMSRLFSILPVLLCVSLASCRQPQDTSGGSTPEASLRAAVATLRDGKLDALLRQALPPADYAHLRADWPRLRQRWSPLPGAGQIGWRQTLRQLAAPHASQTFAAKLLPAQATMEQKYQDQWPIFVTIGAAWLKQEINQLDGPTADQKLRLNRFIAALTPWAQQAAWFDPAKARQAVDVAATTAATIYPHEPGTWRHVGFDAATAKVGIAFAGADRLLSIYGLSLQRMLGSATLSRIDLRGDQATVRLTMDADGQPFSVDMPMLKQDGRWYSADLLNAARRAHQQGRPGSAAAAAKD